MKEIFEWEFSKELYIESIRNHSMEIEQIQKYIQENTYELPNIKSIEEAEEYYKDSYDRFDCGQWYYENDVDVKFMFDGVKYNANIVADVQSSKQDRWDRLYYIEWIEKVIITKI